MIASILGKIIHKTEKFVIIENNDIGYKVFMAENTLSEFNIGDEIKIHTYLHIREDLMDLYGFLNSEDKDFFEMLISVSGIGPKGALNILTIAPVKMIKSAILAGDAGILTKVSGIGQKTAAKIVLELKSKIKNTLSEKDMASYAGEDFKKNMDVLDALTTLGYNQTQAREILKQIPAHLSAEDKIKQGLKLLGK